MCGIFGIIGSTSLSNTKILKREINKLFLLSESRGKEASGIAFSGSKEIVVLKRDIPASSLIKDKLYNDLFDSFSDAPDRNKFEIIGHSRLVTTGSEEIEHNNQPVIKYNNLVIHNGIITNFKQLFEESPETEQIYDVDTEIIPSLFYKYISGNNSVLTVVKKIFQQIEGTASFCLLNSEYDLSILATNNGSLYYNLENDLLVFSSERFILESYLSESIMFKNKNALQLKSDNLIIYNGQFKLYDFNLTNVTEFEKIELIQRKRKIINRINENKESKYVIKNIFVSDGNILQDNTIQIEKLVRCTKCILPETFPYIEFNSDGVCNYCQNYETKFVLNESEIREREQELLNYVKRYQKSGFYDVLVPFSGGRDSSYGLDYIKNKLGLNPVTFTYDWGMITDLARRNISRVCGKLGIENILVSADIRKKREYIRKNVSAWLKKPELGMIPLFMAGDKQFFRIVNILKKQNNLDLNIWMTNPLENTDFKTGFAGIKPDFHKRRIYDLRKSDKVRLVSFYLRNYFMNPSYLNTSIPDTISAFLSYYVSKRKDYVHLFNYIPWDENKIEKYLINEYNWELATDTKSSWRIGDGTASFYNYIYYTVAGFTENDTFRSNQIREGMVTREFALEKIYEENKPRKDSLIWYFDVLGLDGSATINIINNIPKLYF